MSDIYIKKYWGEENILFYFHYQDGIAIEQLEITPTRKIYLTIDNPIKGESMLTDQKLDIDRDGFEKEDFITKEEFEEVWNSR